MGAAFVNTVLERVDADAIEGVEEAFFVGTVFQVNLDDLLDHIRHFAGRERWADDLAKLGLVALTAAQRDLVELVVVLVHAEYADVANVMVTAGIHAARDIEVDVADVEQVVEVVEAGLDG